MFDIDKFYEILSLLYYNPERTRLIENILKVFFENPSQDFNINDAFDIEQKKELSDKKSRFIAENPIIKELFLQYDSIQIAGPNNDEMLEYVKQRYGNFDDAFGKKYGIKLETFLNIITILLNIVKDKALRNKFLIPQVYEFENKEEYADMRFLAHPEEHYIKSLKETITIYIDEITLKDNKIDRNAIICFLNLYSFDADKIKSKNDLRFREYPIFICNNKIVFINPAYCVRFLPQKIHNLLLDVKSYKSNKGLSFESIALETVSKIPNMKLLDTNIKYEKDSKDEENGELDGLINGRRSTWFIECKSRQVSSKSYLGDINKIQKDLEESIKNALKQGIRAIENKDSESFKEYNIHKNIGILIIVEGIFPNILFPETHIPNTLSCEYSFCVLNIFELQELLECKNIGLFEEFLIWRSKKNMPIYCFDQCDYWEFFSKMRNDNRLKIGFKNLIKNHSMIIYHGNWFNDKRYLNKMKNEII